VVMKLSKILRFMLYESGRTFISIAEEIKLMEDYIDLEKIRYNQQLKVIFTKEIDNAEQPLSPLLLLPFVENAFKHGASESFFDASIHIALRLQEGQLFFYIENSKEEEAVPAPGGNNIGLTNIKRQLELMYTDHQLLVDNQPKKFIVQLKVNLLKHGEI
jgi:LytS/YehU family sensor histidine kinase